MEANGKASKSGDELILMVEEKDSKTSHPDASKDQRSKAAIGYSHGESTDSHLGSSNVHSTCPSPEIARFTPSPNKPPRIPTAAAAADTLNRRKSFTRSAYSKPKSRFGEQSLPIDSTLFEEISSNSPIRSLPLSTSTRLKETVRTASFTAKTPLMASPGPAGGFAGDEGYEKIYHKVSSRNKLKYKRVKMKVSLEWLLFLLFLGCLIASLTVKKFEDCKIWGLWLWKWCVLVMVTFSGMLLTNWFMNFIVLLIELNFLLKKKVLYFVHGLKKSVKVFIWLCLVLMTWICLFYNNHEGKRSPTVSKILNYITWTIVSLLIGTFLWLLKTLLLKILASSFHVNTFFDRIQDSLFHQYILQTLSGAPLMESSQVLGRANTRQFSFRTMKKVVGGKEKKEKQVIDMNKIHQMKREKVSAWTMKTLVDVISTSGLSTLSSSLEEESVYDVGSEQTDKEITNEEEAIAAAYHIFMNVARPCSKYIYECDLRRFMIKEEVEIVFQMIDSAETGSIDGQALTDWVLKVYKGRKALAHALTDTKTAVKQLNKLVTGILMIIIVIIWLLLMEIATTKVLVFLSSQLVVAAFMFGNTCKTIFEAIIFVFVMHPFDVGDRCVVDGVQMIVEEMNILNTVFLKYDNEKIYYPNSVLATKPIGNFYRSPDMSDVFEFCIDFRTPIQKIGDLKDRIKLYLDRNPQYWHTNHNLVVKEIEDVNKIKMALFFNHTMNFQDYGEKIRRRTELILEMKKFFEELSIKYDLLPQQVHLVHPATAS